MGVSIHEVVGTIQRAPERAPAEPGSRREPAEPPPLPVDELRTVLAREARMAARVRAD